MGNSPSKNDSSSCMTTTSSATTSVGTGTVTSETSDDPGGTGSSSGIRSSNIIDRQSGKNEACTNNNGDSKARTNKDGVSDNLISDQKSIKSKPIPLSGSLTSNSSYYEWSPASSTATSDSSPDDSFIGSPSKIVKPASKGSHGSSNSNTPTPTRSATGRSHSRSNAPSIISVQSEPLASSLPVVLEGGVKEFTKSSSVVTITNEISVAENDSEKKAIPRTDSRSSKSTKSVRSTPPSTPDAKPVLDLTDMIKRLLAVGFSGRFSKNICLTNSEIMMLCQSARNVFLSQPTLLELGTPVRVVGDIHGQYGDLMRIFQLCGFPPKSNYLFLGDYVDRGKQSLETILLLLCFKVKYPENVFLLRGNHECSSVTKVYGFYDECKRRASTKIWKAIVDVFNTLPIAATIGGKIFCVHGGLSPYLTELQDIKNTITRPTDIPDVGLLSDLLWSDPDKSVSDWGENDRGVSYCFGKSVVDSFCKKFSFDLIARGHMVVEDGYEFFAKRKLVTVFSAPNYCGEFNNWGAVMSVSKDLLCSFELLKPMDAQGIRRALKAGRDKVV